MAYEFYFGKVPMPVAPSDMQLKIGSQNKTYTLIDGNEINVLKSAKLTEISFNLMLPSVEYPFATYVNGFKPASMFLEYFESLKSSKEPFQFIVNRKLPNGKVLFDTNMKVSLEDYSVKETAKEGFDITVSIKLKQYKDFGTKTLKVENKNNTSKASVTNTRPTSGNAPSGGTSYTVKKGDCLWNIAKKFYGNGAKYTIIAEANKGKIKKPNLIYPGMVLTIPNASTTTNNTKNTTTKTSTKTKNEIETKKKAVKKFANGLTGAGKSILGIAFKDNEKVTKWLK